ncbi:hypothetical protein [Thermomonas carbonis]|uniref:Uncharacterized protein n=1 Tax=Thermomonas carbonis TaxID=1463158 RepID=A0A7G9SRQ3_9GAMM|nr:hypothetical protein [Thermomonas carbonis]QNN70528.1 hypothetical protein H9L16_02575 [Thermomonas carbonis]
MRSHVHPPASSHAPGTARGIRRGLQGLLDGQVDADREHHAVGTRPDRGPRVTIQRDPLARPQLEAALARAHPHATTQHAPDDGGVAASIEQAIASGQDQIEWRL